MLSHVGGAVTALHRDTFGSLDASALPPGQMRPLTAAELSSIPGMLPPDRVTKRELDQPRRAGHAAQGGQPSKEEGEDNAGPEEEDGRIEKSRKNAAPRARRARGKAKTAPNIPSKNLPRKK